MKKLPDGSTLEIVEITPDETEDHPENNLRLMLYPNADNEVGQKFAAKVCALLSCAEVRQLFMQIESREAFFRLEREKTQEVFRRK